MKQAEAHKLVERQQDQASTVIDVLGHKIGGDHFTVMAGPCSIESREQMSAIAKAVSAQGAEILRGGAFKPRTSPYDFQGLGEEGLIFLKEAAKAHDMLTVSEVMSIEELPLVEKHIDILQVGSRNMQNFSLLKAVGKSQKPVLLKRGLAATYHEFLNAAEYILSHGNPNVILCERGIRTFETHTRNTLDLAAVPALREMTHLPIIVDPSHGTGKRELVCPMAVASLALKADGIMVEVHTDPDNSISDAAQTISPAMFETMMSELKPLSKLMQKTLSTTVA
jgi:3-deoxy-7-phosphoheptulonate synthase